MKKDGISGEVTFFANGDPQKPQAFYPLDNVVTLNKGDTVFARCVYNSMDKDNAVNIGSTAGDEMCNLYLMYYYEVENRDFFECSREDDAQMSRLADEAIAKVDKAPKVLSTVISNKMAPLIGQKFQFEAKNIGDICGLTYDVYGNVVVLNRGNHKWDAFTFSW